MGAGLFFTKLWWGQYPLVRSFWVFYVLGIFIAPLIAIVGMLPIYFFSRGAALAIGATLYGAYLIVASVGVWRSADAYPYARWWPNLAKTVVVIIVARMGWGLLNGGAEHFVQYVTQR